MNDLKISHICYTYFQSTEDVQGFQIQYLTLDTSNPKVAHQKIDVELMKNIIIPGQASNIHIYYAPKYAI